MQKRRADPTSVRFRRLRVRRTVATGTPKFSLDNALGAAAGFQNGDGTPDLLVTDFVAKPGGGFVIFLGDRFFQLFPQGGPDFVLFA